MNITSQEPEAESTLEFEIAQALEKVFTDDMKMSLGEFISLYNVGDWTISPDFQRYYRWNLDQKSRFIESLLLGFPIPPVYVAVDEDGKYLTIDGLQRLSTILEFTGHLEKPNVKSIPNNKKIGVSGLRRQKFLPSLEGITWEKLSQKQQRIFKGKRLELRMLEAQTGTNIKFEVFNRLNSGQAALSPQEIRNCLILMYDKVKFKKFKSLAAKTNFQSHVFDSLSETKQQEAYHEDMLFRMILATLVDKEPWLKRSTDYNHISPQLDSFVEEVFQSSDLEKALSCASLTIDLIAKADVDFQFKKYDSGSYHGEFSVSLFEYIGISLSKFLYTNSYTEISLIPRSELTRLTSEIKARRDEQPERYKEMTKHGSRPVSRFYNVIELGKYD